MSKALGLIISTANKQKPNPPKTTPKSQTIATKYYSQDNLLKKKHQDSLSSFIVISKIFASLKLLVFSFSELDSPGVFTLHLTTGIHPGCEEDVQHWQTREEDSDNDAQTHQRWSQQAGLDPYIEK